MSIKEDFEIVEKKLLELKEMLKVLELLIKSLHKKKLK